MKLTPRIALEIAHHEAIVREAYKDSVGVWTWSVGLTNGSGHDVKQYVGKPQTLEHCLKVYVDTLETYAEQVRQRFAGYYLSENEFAGALSWHWNTGAVKSATWPKLFMAGDREKARVSFMSWKRPSEIIPRRTKEAKLLFDGLWDANGQITEYGVTSKGYPNWGSAKKVRIDDILARFMEPVQPQLPGLPVDVAIGAVQGIIANLSPAEAIKRIREIVAQVV